ncbi:MAG: UDP-N-acetylmuramate dehydrogenase [Ruminococcus sp.]|nr:UDP-N-acetylmuramate dehydrogenase [Ruminococcus sp.]
MLVNELARLGEEFGCKVSYDEPLSKHTTFHIGGPCRCMIEPDGADALSELVRAANESEIPMLILGKGSNMLCDDRGFDGAVILLGEAMGSIKLTGNGTIYAECGASLLKLCRFALDNSLSGLEFAYGIPGTVGGGIYMNAGAYGGEMKDVLKSVTAMERSGEIKKYDASQLELTYRSSRFAYSDEIILGGEFKLESAEKEKIESRMNELLSRRKLKQPLEYPNAGSTFKRPEGQFAGKLIEESGLRGARAGGAQVSEKHCGFVINTGGATSEDVRTLINRIKETVYQKTGFELECEVKIIPYSIKQQN